MSNSTILVIDDDSEILDVIVFILIEAGYKVVTGTDVTALYAIEKEPPALLLLDNWLSGEKTGHDICYQLKHDPRTAAIPVLLISATSQLEETARRCGADGYISKPFDNDALLRQVSVFVPVTS